MTKADFILLSVKTVLALEEWLTAYSDHTQLTTDQLVTVNQAKEIIDQVAVRLARKESSLH